MKACLTQGPERLWSRVFLTHRPWSPVSNGDMKEEETLEPTWVHSSCFQGAARRGRRSPNQAGQDPGVQAPVTFQFLVEGGVGMYSSSDSKRFCSLVSLGSLNRVIKLC